MKANIDLKQSINTTSINEDIKNLGKAGELIKNNGIHNDGGITNLYLNTDAYTEGEHFTADTGEDIQTIVDGDNMGVSVGGQQIGVVSSLGVKHRELYKGYDDVMVGKSNGGPVYDNVIATCQLSGGNVVVKVFTEEGEEIPALGRTLTFTQIGLIGSSYQSLNFVRENGYAVNNPLKFILRSGTKAILLDESELTSGEQDYRTSLFAIDWNQPTATVTIPGKYTAILSGKGRMSSVDIYGKWKYWDGTGDGSGPFLNVPESWAVTANTFRMIPGGTFGELVITYAITGPAYKMFSYDGSQWKYADGTGTGTGVYSADIPGNVAQVFSYTYAGDIREALFIGSSSGRLSSFDYLKRFKRYDGLGDGVAYYSAGAFIGTDAIYGLVVWGNNLIVWGQATAGRVGSLDSFGVAKAYNGGGTGTGPYDNNTALAAQVYWIGDGPAGEMVLAGASGRIGSWDGANWKTYAGAGAGTGIYSNATAVPSSQTIYSFTNQTINGESVFIVIGSGSVGSYSPSTGWKKSDGTGTGSGPYQANDTSGMTNSRMYTIVPAPAGGKTLFIGGAQVAQINADGTIKTGTIGINFNTQISEPGSGVRSCLYEYNGKQYFVWGQQNISSYCFDTGLFKFSDGSGGGDGPFAPTGLTAIFGGGNVASLCQYNTFLVALDLNVGRVASWNGTAWTNYDGSGAAGGIFSNTLNVVPSAYNNMVVYKTFLCIGGGSSRLQSFDGIAWKRYDGTGTGTGPYIAGPVIGSNQINSLGVWESGGVEYLIVGGDGGRLGNWNGTAWKTYLGAGGTGPSSNGTVVGASNIYTVSQYGKYLIVGSSDGKIGSWDPTLGVWKAYDGTLTGTGPYDNATCVGVAEISCLYEYDRTLIVKSPARMGSINSDNVISKYTDTNGYNQPDESNTALFVQEVNGQLLAYGIYGSLIYGQNAERYAFNFDLVNRVLTLPYNDRGQLFAYYFPDENAYLFGVPGNTKNLFVMYANGICYPIRAKYAVAKEFSGGNHAEIILTADPLMFEDKYRIKSRVGYIDDGDFSPVEQYPVYSLGRPTTYLESECGPGYSQGNLSVLGDTSVYSAFGPTDQGAEYTEAKTNTDSLIGNRGKLGNFYTVPINGFLGGLSYAAGDDQVGVTLTALGEIDQSYIPQAFGNFLVYFSTEGHVFLKIASDIDVRIERIGTNLYKLNTVSPLNIINVEEKKMYLGSLDYNGRLLVTDNAAINSVIKRVVGLVSARYSNSYDTGEDLAGVTALTADKITAPGAKITGSGFIAEQFGINVFIDDEYDHTIDETGASEIIPALDGTIYIEDSREPMPMIADYQDGIAVIAGKTFYLAGDDYDGAESGNSLPGSYGYFNLFGQDYIFDDSFIYLLTIDDAGLIVSKAKTAPKIGLTYISVSPTAAFFYSTFDGGLYVFDGGRTVQKQDKLNRLGNVIGGVYSTYEAALYLETSAAFVVYRDGIKTGVLKMAEMSGLRLYDTEQGVKFGNNDFTWSYSYRSGDALLPLSIQTAYMGAADTLVKVSAIVAQISSPTKEATDIIYTIRSYDEHRSREVEKTVRINANDWDGNGIAYIRIRPENARAVGVSAEIVCNEKIILVGMWYEYELDTKITTPRSV